MREGARAGVGWIVLGDPLRPWVFSAPDGLTLDADVVEDTGVGGIVLSDPLRPRVFSVLDGLTRASSVIVFCPRWLINKIVRMLLLPWMMLLLVKIKSGVYNRFSALSRQNRFAPLMRRSAFNFCQLISKSDPRIVELKEP